jgi:hypothetical protein
MWELGTPEHSMESLEKLNSADLTTDWGVRLLSSKSQYYNPVGYNYGAIWPFVTGWVNMALFTHQQSLQGFQLLQANMQHTFTDQLGMMPEVLSGMLNTPLEESVSHQGFSSGGVVLPFVRGLCGLTGSEVEKHLEWAPRFPANWENVTIDNYRIGSRSFSMNYQRSDSLLHAVLSGEKVTGFTFRFAPALGIGTEITSVTLNGKKKDWETQLFSQQIQVPVESLFDRDSMEITIHMKPTVELLPIAVTTKTGDLNHGLKLIHLKRSENTLMAMVEGRAGMAYALHITHPEMVASVEGARLQENRLLIEIPHHEDEFVQKQIKLKIK